jgi:putative nucleotidyltransferase with HDIG domain
MFGGLFGRGQEKATPQKKEQLAPAVATTILNVVGSKSIPPMPGAAQKAFQLATDPNAEARDFIEVIESDEALSARVIKIANSVYFDRGNKSATIEASVTVIGINELRCLLNATALAEIFPSKHPARPMLWANDIATALIARSLAQRLRPGKEDSAFLAGLMHDIGKLLLLQRSGEEYARVLKIVETEEKTFLEAEERRFPFTHTEVGQLIGERWNFSAELIDIIRNHHRAWTDEDFTTREVSLTAIVKAADIFAHALGLGHLKGFSKLRAGATAQLEDTWRAMKVEEIDRKGALENFEKTFALEFDLFTPKASA